MRTNFYREYYNTYSSCFVEETNPAPMEAFLKIGVTPDQFYNYLGIIAKLYGQLLTNGNVEQKVYNQLIAFCRKNELILEDEAKQIINRPGNITVDNALMHYRLRSNKRKWLREARSIEEFRYHVEIMLSLIDQRHVILNQKFEIAYNQADNSLVKLDHPDTKLTSAEYANLCSTIQSELQLIRKEMTRVFKSAPDEYKAEDFSSARRWLRVYDKLRRNYHLLNEVLAMISEMQNQHSIPELTAKDRLFVRMGKDVCDEKEHFQHSTAVALRFVDGTTEMVRVKRCFDCQLYYIDLDDFVKFICSKGTPTVSISYVSDGSVWENAGLMAVESIYKQYGYNVSQIDGLSAPYRQTLLSDIIAKRIRTKEETIQFLSMLISVNGKKKENWLALKKWQEDLAYVVSL